MGERAHHRGGRVNRSARGVAGVLALGILACSGDDPPASAVQALPETSQPWPDQPRSGEDVYRQYCIACHREDGQGKPGEVPGLVGALERPDAEIEGIIRQGVPAEPVGMPAHGGLLTDDEIRRTVAYLRRRFESPEEGP
jgi:mono/diheme cytochrome c family protein